jgi:phosphoribosylaminoimidazolecarboxamide formyltransferase/IMP cyclohydrolase
MAEDLKKAYRTIMDDHFPPSMEISFVDGEKRTTLIYEKCSWVVDGVKKGLRYGENPGQQAALYRLVNGNLVLGEVETIKPGRYLVSNLELLQAGKHPGKINLTDVDNGLNILRHLMERPTVAIMKHNNPCGVAMAPALAEAYHRANLADRVAAFGGAIVCNRAVDRVTAEQIAENYAEVVAAPDYENGAVEILAGRKNLRILRLSRMTELAGFAVERFVDFKSLLDGGIVAQTSFVPLARTAADLKPAVTTRKGKRFAVQREPSAAETADMLFGWMVESGVTSNSVIYVKDGVTLGIGTGEQDRVGVARIARDKAYTKWADACCWQRYRTPFNLLKDADKRAEINAAVQEAHGGLNGAVMVSDAFFPFRDGAEVGLQEGVSGVLQPGGSLNDYQTIEAVNEYGATMKYTGQRSFKH